MPMKFIGLANNRPDYILLIERDYSNIWYGDSAHKKDIQA